ncbi:MAG: TIGR02300 family protein [Alphaproteobacteria bacterium]|nr:TIGR02300 family protein [Alphaproteobacteria bacterium]
MAKPEWGIKRLCPHCGTRYYDMKKNPPVCPSCGTVFDPETLTKSRRSRAAEEKTRKAVPTPEALDDLPIVPDDGEDVLIEDADELGEDAVDVEDVVVVENDDER